MLKQLIQLHTATRVDCIFTIESQHMTITCHRCMYMSKKTKDHTNLYQQVHKTVFFSSNYKDNIVSFIINTQNRRSFS